MQVAIYAGVPAGVDSFRIAQRSVCEVDKALKTPPHGEGAKRRLRTVTSPRRANQRRPLPSTPAIAGDGRGTRPPQDGTI